MHMFCSDSICAPWSRFSLGRLFKPSRLIRVWQRQCCRTTSYSAEIFLLNVKEETLLLFRHANCGFFKRCLSAGVTEKAQAIVHWNKHSSVREFPIPITLPGLHEQYLPVCFWLHVHEIKVIFLLLMHCLWWSTLTTSVVENNYLEIRRISSIRRLQTTKVTAQQMCSFVLSRLDYCNILLIDINCDQTAGCKEFKTTQRKLFFARADMNTLDHCSKRFTGCQSRKG